jgi:hypothetical protein
MQQQSIVTRIPVEKLTDKKGEFEARRERFLSKEALRELLKRHPVEFVIADIGKPLKRIDVAKCHDFWESEVQAHIVNDPNGEFRLEDFPGQQAYIASEWSGEIQTPIVLLEKYH